MTIFRLHNSEVKNAWSCDSTVSCSCFGVISVTRFPFFFFFSQAVDDEHKKCGDFTERVWSERVQVMSREV